MGFGSQNNKAIVIFIFCFRFLRHHKLIQSILLFFIGQYTAFLLTVVFFNSLSPQLVADCTRRQISAGLVLTVIEAHSIVEINKTSLLQTKLVYRRGLSTASLLALHIKFSSSTYYITRLSFWVSFKYSLNGSKEKLFFRSRENFAMLLSFIGINFSVLRLMEEKTWLDWKRVWWDRSRLSWKSFNSGKLPFLRSIIRLSTQCKTCGYLLRAETSHCSGERHLELRI